MTSCDFTTSTKGLSLSSLFLLADTGLAFGAAMRRVMQLLMKHLLHFWSVPGHFVFLCINPLNAKPKNLSNTLKAIRGQKPTNCLNVFDQFVRLRPEGLKDRIWNKVTEVLERIHRI